VLLSVGGGGLSFSPFFFSSHREGDGRGRLRELETENWSDYERELWSTTVSEFRGSRPDAVESKGGVFSAFLGFFFCVVSFRNVFSKHASSPIK